MSDFKAFIEQLKERADIVEVIRDTGKLTPVGRGKYISTKEHDSLSIDPERGWYVWYSRQNQPGGEGDVITWLQHHGGKPEFVDALRYLSERTGVHFEWNERQTQAYLASKAQHDALALVAQFLHSKLKATPAALDYARGRGWTDETIDQAKLGYWDWPLANELRGWLAMHEIDQSRPEIAAVLGLRDVDVAVWGTRWNIEPDREWVEKGKIPGMPGGMLIYPHWNRGRCVYLSGRGIAEKFHWNMRERLVGARKPYFNLVYTRQSDLVVVVEGQADAVTLAQWGVSAVALCGCAMSDRLLETLEQHKRLVLALDGDKPGERGARELASLLGPGTPVVSWPGGSDANDWLNRGGTKKLCLALLAQAPIFALWSAARVFSAPPLEQTNAKRAVYELIASLMPYDYATNIDQLAQALQTTQAGVRAVVRAIKAERDAGALAAASKGKAEGDGQPKVNTLADGDRPTLSRDDEEYLIGQSRDHEGHAQCVNRIFGEQIAFVPEWGWLTYNGKFWDRPGADHGVQGFVVQTLKARRHLAVEHELDPLVSASGCKRPNVLATQGMLERMVLASVADFDNSPDLLNCNNGVVDLRTGVLYPHDPRQRFTYCLPTDYEAKADYSEWLLFLMEVTGSRDEDGVNHIDHELIDWLQMAVGYSLTGYTREGCIFYLYGPTRSGKGTFTQTLLNLLGTPLGGSIDFNVLTQQRSEDSQNFALAPLKPCRLLVGNEPGKYERFNEAKMKQLTGEDPVRCAYKNRDQFEYLPQFKIWLSSNWPFNADTSDDAAWGRARVVIFPNSFLGREDKGLKGRLQSPEGLRGVLAWAVEGARKWYETKDGGMTTPASVNKITKAQRHEQDFVQQFIDDCCVTEAVGTRGLFFTPTAELYQAYVGWCQGMLTPQKNRSFSLSLKGKGFPDGKQYIDVGPKQATLFNGNGVMGIERKQVRGFFGIRLNEDGLMNLAEKEAKIRHKTQ